MHQNYGFSGKTFWSSTFLASNGYVILSLDQSNYLAHSISIKILKKSADTLVTPSQWEVPIKRPHRKMKIWDPSADFTGIGFVRKSKFLKFSLFFLM